MLAHLRERAGSGGVLSYRDFTAAALYAPGLGYYTRAEADRVGRRDSADFYTASSLQGGIFGKLLRATAETLLAPAAAREHVLMEIGAEPGAGVFGGEAGSFARVETRRVGEPIEPMPLSVVFANELLDAQPFHRLVFRRGAWRELGVRVDDAALEEVELAEMSPAAEKLQVELPQEATEEYHLDISLDAEEWLRQLATAPWKGLLILDDYGYDWNDLVRERPAGTARAYFRHEASRDLLARPGEQDLTCHVCWDRLEGVLRAGGFEVVRVERQEAFFMHHAGALIEEMLAKEAGRFSPNRQTLLELLHPTHLGHKFQILSARRK
jgi:SAM-dependent MidA family methyltransferase